MYPNQVSNYLTWVSYYLTWVSNYLTKVSYYPTWVHRRKKNQHQPKKYLIQNLYLAIKKSMFTHTQEDKYNKVVMWETASSTSRKIIQPFFA